MDDKERSETSPQPPEKSPFIRYVQVHAVFVTNIRDLQLSIQSGQGEVLLEISGIVLRLQAVNTVWTIKLENSATL
jgi:hypothetical protein